MHLIIDPGDTPEHLGMLMKRVAGRQTRYVNRLEGRSGTLWEGRFLPSLKPQTQARVAGPGRQPGGFLYWPKESHQRKCLVALRSACLLPAFQGVNDDAA